MLNITVSRVTIYRWVILITKNGISSRISQGRPRTVRTTPFIAKIHINVCQSNTRKSARKKSREEGCAPKTVRLRIRDDLSLKAYKNIRVPALTDAHIVKRKYFCIWITSIMNHVDLSCFLTRNGSIKIGNIIAKMTDFMLYQDMGTRPEHKFSFKVMVWIGVNFSGLTQVVILPQKTTFDSDFYVEKWYL